MERNALPANLNLSLSLSLSLSLIFRLFYSSFLFVTRFVRIRSGFATIHSRFSWINKYSYHELFIWSSSVVVVVVVCLGFFLFDVFPGLHQRGEVGGGGLVDEGAGGGGLTLLSLCCGFCDHWSIPLIGGLPVIHSKCIRFRLFHWLASSFPLHLTLLPLPPSLPSPSPILIILDSICWLKFQQLACLLRFSCHYYYYLLCLASIHRLPPPSTLRSPPGFSGFDIDAIDVSELWQLYPTANCVRPSDDLLLLNGLFIDCSGALDAEPRSRLFIDWVDSRHWELRRCFNHSWSVDISPADGHKTGRINSKHYLIRFVLPVFAIDAGPKWRTASGSYRRRRPTRRGTSTLTSTASTSRPLLRPSATSPSPPPIRGKKIRSSGGARHYFLLSIQMPIPFYGFQVFELNGLEMIIFCFCWRLLNNFFWNMKKNKTISVIKKSGDGGIWTRDPFVKLRPLPLLENQ